MNSAQTMPLDRTTLLITDTLRPVSRRLERALAGSGERVLAVSNAADALRTLRQTPCQLILLDAELPDVDVFALCRLLRAQRLKRRPRILFFAPQHQEASKLSAFDAGADDYLAPPITDRELLARVQTHLDSARREWALGGRNRELEFLADLGRSLLRARTPKEVARRVAGAVYEGLNAPLCVALLFLEPAAPTAHGFDRQGLARGAELVDIRAVGKWLARTPAILQRRKDARRFFLRDRQHCVEYAVPLVFDKTHWGAIVVGFDRAEDGGATEEKLLETAAQQAALAAHISTLYAAARESSQRLALEVAARTQEIEEQRRLTAAIIDSLPVSLYAVDRNYRIVAWNRRREDGDNGIPRQDVLGRQVFNVLRRQPRAQLQEEFAQVFASGEITRFEKTVNYADGSEHHWHISKVPMSANNDDTISHVITIGENVTAAVNAQRAVARAEKLAAVGRLAAGVVHEINNPLATISACAEALSTLVAEGVFDQATEVADLREYLDIMRSEVFRCKNITMGLLDFSRTRAATQNPVQIDEVLRSAARLIQHQAHDGVKIKLEAPKNLHLVMGDASQLQQAVIALSTNAMDAMPDGGLLTLNARNGGKELFVEVTDTGCGIAPEHLPRIFDPFFTTKEVGRGTGLGLAVCYGIVTEHGGRLNVESKPGHGTKFTIALPALPVQAG
jgi:two-component system NtrC family sensor kinase